MFALFSSSIHIPDKWKPLLPLLFFSCLHILGHILLFIYEMINLNTFIIWIVIILFYIIALMCSRKLEREVINLLKGFYASIFCIYAMIIIYVSREIYYDKGIIFFLGFSSGFFIKNTLNHELPNMILCSSFIITIEALLMEYKITLFFLISLISLKFYFFENITCSDLTMLLKTFKPVIPDILIAAHLIPNAKKKILTLAELKKNIIFHLNYDKNNQNQENALSLLENIELKENLNEKVPLKISSKPSTVFSPNIFTLIQDFHSSYISSIAYNYTCTLKSTEDEQYFTLRLFLTRTKTHFLSDFKNENKNLSEGINKYKLEQNDDDENIFTPPQRKDWLFLFRKLKNISLFFTKFVDFLKKMGSKISLLTNKNRKTFIFISLSPLFQSINLKKAQELNNFKDQMLANVAHDLQSPINGILAFLELARESTDEKEREKNLNYAKLSSHSLLNLISDILDFSQFRKGKLSVHVSPFPIQELLNETLMNIELQARLKGIALQVQNDFDPDFEIISDKRRISQLLLNLLGNAVKFTRKGIIKLKICQTQFKNVMKFEIIDSGIGIKPNLLSKLFQAFATFDTEHGLNKYGIGLGLNICKMIVKLLGPSEDLYVSSKYQKGTKFGFLIFTELSKKGGRKTYPVTNKSIQNQVNCFQPFSKKNLPLGLQENNSAKISLLNKNKKKRNLTDRIKKDKNLQSSDHDQKPEIKEFEEENEEISFKKSELRKTDSYKRKAKRPVQKSHFNFEEDHALEIDYLESPLPLEKETPVKLKKPHLNRYSSQKEKNSTISLFANVQSLKQLSLHQRSISNKKSRRKLKGNRQSSLPNMDNLKTMTGKINFDELLAKNFLNESKQLIAYDFFSSFDEDEANEGYLNGIDEFPTGKILSPITRISNSFKGSPFSFDMYLRKLNVLLVDENPFNILIISEYLKKAVNYKISILSTYNGSLAVEYFQKYNKINQANPIDIIFMDCQMPIMDGFEASRLIKGLIESKEYQDTYIVAITAYMDEKKCYDNGMDDFLMKPVSEREFLQILEQCLCEN